MFRSKIISIVVQTETERHTHTAKLTAQPVPKSGRCLLRARRLSEPVDRAVDSGRRAVEASRAAHQKVQQTTMTVMTMVTSSSESSRQTTLTWTSQCSPHGLLVTFDDCYGRRLRPYFFRCSKAFVFSFFLVIITYADAVAEAGFFTAVCLCVFPHDISKSVAARFTKLHTEMFPDEYWKPIYFGVKRLTIKVISHKNIAGVHGWLHSCERWLLLV